MSGCLPHALLPAELWLDIYCLCEPSPRLPATCHLTLNSLRTPESPAHRIWSHRVVFLNPEYDPKVVNAGNSNAQKCRRANLSNSSVAQIESRLSYYLKAHAPSAIGGAFRVATGLAPQKQTETTGLLTKEFVQWLFFGIHGPLGIRAAGGGHGRTSSLDVVAEMRAIHSERLLVTSGFDRGTLEFPNWRPLSDTLLLAHFFIRTSQLDLFQLTLTHLLNLFPALATAAAPISLWTHFMVDNRSRLICDLWHFEYSHRDRPVAYPTFLCLLATFDWSLDALTIIQRTFASTTTFTQIAQTIAATHHMQQAILHTLFQVISPTSTADRVLDVLSWYKLHGARLGNPFVSNHITSIYPGTYPIASQVFVKYDLLYVIQERVETVVVLGHMLVDWAMDEPEGYDCGHVELKLALEHGLLSAEDKSKLVYKGAYSEEQALVDLMVASCANEEELVSVVRKALNTSIVRPPDPPAIYSAILSNLPTSIDLTTAILIPSSYRWAPASLSVLLFDCPAIDPRIKWDYPRYLRQQLETITNRPDSDWDESPIESVEHMQFMAKLIDRAWQGEPDDANCEWDAVHMASMCAMRLVALMFDMGIARGSKVIADMALSLGEDQVGMYAAMMAATKDKLMGQPLLAVVSGEFKKLLRFGIVAVAAYSPPAGVAGWDSASAAAHRVFFDSLVELDRGFVLEGVKWRDGQVAAEVRARFESSELAQ